MTWRRAVDRGDALRLAPGVYCLTASWFSWEPWDRYLVAAVAHARSRRDPVVFTGLTAALVHGLPTIDVPTELFVRAGSAGRAGQQRPLHLYPGTNDVAMAYKRHFDATGQTFTGTYPVLPAIRRRWITRPDGQGPEAVSVALSAGARLGEVLADPVHVTLADILASEHSRYPLHRLTPTNGIMAR